MGGTLDPLRDKNASADRLLSLIESGNSLQAQTRLALLLQKRYRGWKTRMLVAEKRAEMEENRLRDEASSKVRHRKNDQRFFPVPFATSVNA